jgi:predicted ATPase
MDYLAIKNFKCFKDAHISLNRLTVLTGANGYGKSTTIQALLYLRKSIELNSQIIEGKLEILHEKINTNISLNSGYLLSLGVSSNVININAKDDTIEIGLYDKDEDVRLRYFANITEPKLYLTLDDIEYSGNFKLNLLKKEFYYLNAERLGPRIQQIVNEPDFPNSGYQGENVAYLISSLNYKYSVPDERKHPSTQNKNYEPQINAWLNDIIPGVSITAKENLDTLTAQIRIENEMTKGAPTIATNIGFGISYILPIIATGLLAKKGSYMIIENPEAHLHPSAQSRIGQFIAMVARAGVNVIVETHSDHVVNGIQIAVAKQKIHPDYVTIHFFSHNAETSEPHVEEIQITQKGELTKWPAGFFDQSQRDFAELFKIRKG